MVRRRGLLAGALAGVLAAAVAIPIFAFAGGSGGGGGSAVSSESVALLDPSGDVVRAVDVPGSPGAVAVGEGAVWVADSSANTVSKINAGSNEVNDTIQVGGGPAAVAVGGGAVWVANGLDGTVSRIDPATGDETRITVGNGPAGITYGEGAVWVVNAADGTVSRIDPARSAVVGRPLRVGATGPGIAVGAGAVWVTDQLTRNVTRVDVAGGARQTVPVGNGPTGIAFSGGSLWVANSLDGTVSKIEAVTNAVRWARSAGAGPTGVAVSAGSVWVTNELGGAVTRLDPTSGRLLDVVQTGSQPSGLAASPGGVWLSTAPDAAAHRGGTLRVRGYQPDSIDPGVAYDDASWSILSMTNDGLVAFRRRGGSEGLQLVPDLATSLPVPTDGGRTYTFQVRPGIRYSNGDVVRASDFRRAIERVFRLRSDGEQFYQGIVGASVCARRPAGCDLSRGIVADDAARTVTFRLTAPDSDLLYKLALPFAYAVPKSVVPRKATTPVPSTGPYLVKSHRPGRALLLVRNPRFRQWSHAAQPGGFADEIELRAGAAEASAVVRGAADLALNPPAEELAALELRHPSQLHVNLRRATIALALGTRVPPFDRLDVRKALNHAVDRAVVARLAGGADLARPTCQILPPNFPSYRPYCPYGFDLAKATRLVAGSGTRGQAVTVWTSPDLEADLGKPGAYAVSVLRQLGYRASLRSISDVGRYFTAVYDPRRHVQLAVVGWLADYASASQYFQPNFGCGSDPNASQFCDRTVESGIRRAGRVQASDPLAANDLWADVDREVVDAAPWVPLVNPAQVTVVSKRVGNYQYNPQWGVLLDQLWVR